MNSRVAGAQIGAFADDESEVWLTIIAPNAAKGQGPDWA